MTAGLVNHTVGDGNSGTFSGKFLSDTGAAGGNLTPAPTLYDSTGAEALGTTADAAYAGSGNSGVIAALKGIYTKAAALVAAITTNGSRQVMQTTLYDSSGNAIDFTVASPTYPLPATPVSGVITTAMTGTTSTSLVAAPGAGLRNYITAIIVSNSHATVGTDVVIQDGSGGTTLLTIPAAAAYGGAAITLPTPLKQPTANTAIYAQNVTTGSSTKVSAVGFAAA